MAQHASEIGVAKDGGSSWGPGARLAEWMVEDLEHVHVVDPGRASEHPRVPQKTEFPDLPRRVRLAELRDGQQLATPLVVSIEHYVIQVDHHPREVFQRIRVLEQSESGAGRAVVVHVHRHEAY